ncbi:DUF6443 domain-containing protein [Tenacibaculum sp. 190524A02b]|uniref:DUF6443 domain-containing protein n=1 Tax=Tenacibaculum vairaonense TaxID=3137860 RepID=UPI0031FA86D9
MKTKVLILFGLLCTVSIFSQHINIYTNSNVGKVLKESPYNRESLLNVYFEQKGDEWYENGVYVNSTGVHYTSYRVFKKYYLDSDGDGYGVQNNYIVVKSSFKKGNYLIEYSEIPELIYETYHPIILANLSKTFIQVSDKSGKKYEVRKNNNAVLFDGKRWVSNNLGFDCNDTNPNIPTGIQVFYRDNDRDGYGNKMLWTTASIECREFNGSSHFDLVENNEDCNDYNVDVTTEPTKWYKDFDRDGYGNPNEFVLSCSQPFGSYSLNAGDCDDTNPNYNNKEITWYADFDGDGFGDENDTIVAACPPENYITNCYFDKCPTEKGTQEGCAIVEYDFDNENQNYQYQRVYLTPTKIENLELANPVNVIETITYKDGLGRIKQTNAIKQSTSGKDIITHYSYDGNGEQVKEFLPYASTDNAGLFVQDSEQKTIDYYNTSTFDNTTNPYTEVTKENSPLSRVLEIGSPGEPWKVDQTSDNDHTIKKEYGYNTANDHVKFFSVVFENDDIEQPKLTQEGDYNANVLTKLITKNENWQPNQEFEKDNTVELYKDARGREILKRSFDKNNAHDTYFVYDTLDNLTFVLSPKASEKATITQQVLDDLGYQYKYDIKNRLIEKKEPEKGNEYIVYDKLDRLVLSQDALQRAQNKWLYTKYDFEGRVVYTGLYNSTSSRETLQEELSTITSNQFYEEKTTTPTSIGGQNVYYTTVSYPQHTASINVLTLNYYDTYEHVLPTGLTDKVTTSFGVTSSNNTIGLPTVSKKAVLDTNDWITTVTYYDDESRPIYVYEHNAYLNTINIVEYKLDFTGKVLETKETHQKASTDEVAVYNKMTYDRVGRFLSQSQCVSKGEGGCENDLEENRSLEDPVNLINSKTVYASNSIILLPGFSVKATSEKSFRVEITDNLYEKIVTNIYDEFGRLRTKQVGGKGSQRLQKVDFAYNVRGWLKKINDDTDNDNDLFNLNLSYNDPTTGTALFNGNISEISWNTLNTDTSTKKYIYEYDALNRILSATGVTNSKYDVSGISYDKNGNIQKLTRKGHLNTEATSFGVMDNLNYTYNSGNRLKNVTDDANKTHGFKDGNHGRGSEDDYLYDVNGNIVRDANKGITSIDYNHLNLPTKVHFGRTGTIEYVYDAFGIKLRKVVQGVTTDYAGNYVYKNGTLQYFNHTEGYVKSENDQFTYVYQHKDHLGNIRLSYADVNQDGVIDKNNEILEESNYYPFGLKHKGYNNNISSLGNSTAQKFGYNGKELEQALGANLYEMDWRSYDPAIGKWLAMDPVTHFSMSPYTAFDNNPVYWSDPSGMDSEEPEKPGTYEGEVYEDEDGMFIWDGQNWHSDMGGGLSSDEIIINSSGGDDDYEDDTLYWEDIDWGEDVFKEDIDRMVARMHRATGRAAEIIFEAGSLLAPIPGAGIAARLIVKGASRVAASRVMTKIAIKLARSSKINKAIGAAAKGYSKHSYTEIFSAMLSKRLIKITKKLDKKILKEIDALLKQVSKGNMNPGKGNNVIKKGNKVIFREFRGSNARVYFRNTSQGVEILGYSHKGNQQEVINHIIKQHGF